MKHSGGTRVTSDKVCEIYRYLAIDDRLATSGQPSEAQLELAAAAGFDVIINLALHDDPRYSLPDEGELVRSLGMEYVHIPVQFSAPTEPDVLQFFAALETQRTKRVLVHCAANMRVTAFLGLYRALRERRPHDEAFSPMRSIWEPNPVWAKFIAEMLAKHAR